MTGHPYLPAGYNSWENDGDEVDGPGVNEPVWPVLIDSFEALAVFIVSPEMLAVFEGCADYTIPWADVTTAIPGEDRVLQLADAWPNAIVAGTSNVVTFPTEDVAIQVKDGWGELVVPTLVRVGG